MDFKDLRRRCSLDNIRNSPVALLEHVRGCICHGISFLGYILLHQIKRNCQIASSCMGSTITYLKKNKVFFYLSAIIVNFFNFLSKQRIILRIIFVMFIYIYICKCIYNKKEKEAETSSFSA